MVLEEIRHIDSSRRALRSFGLVVGCVISAIGFFLLWKGNGAHLWFWGAGAALVILGLVWPASLLALQKPWMALAIVMGTVITVVILSIVFFGVITPLAITARLARKDFLSRRRDAARATYWVQRDPQTDRGALEKQF